jgi:N utilization substance protein B
VLPELWAALIEEEGVGDARPAESEEVEFAQRLAYGVAERGAEIDALLAEASAHWKLPRMPVVDRNVLRVATFELLALPEVPASVAINEAIEIAKKFGGADSGAFVNGVLDAVARKVGRLEPERRRG